MNNGAFLSMQPASKTALLPEIPSSLLSAKICLCLWLCCMCICLHNSTMLLAITPELNILSNQQTSFWCLTNLVWFSFCCCVFMTKKSQKEQGLTSSPLASRWVSSFKLLIILSSLKSYGKVSVHSVNSWRILGAIFLILIWKCRINT